jgi:hypothetical protein
MLGQLFGSLNSSSNKILESVTDDIHTRNLLFPDSATFQDGGLHTLDSSAESSTFIRTLSPDVAIDKLDLEYPRDIRILIAQHDASKNRLLFDSKPSSSSDSPRSTHVRANSLVGGARVPPIPEDHTNRLSSSFSTSTSNIFPRAGSRRKNSITSVFSVDENAQSPQRQQDEEDIVDIALGCMFQNVTPTYKGPSTKVHIVPRTTKPYDSVICSPFATIPGESLAQTQPPSSSFGRTNSMVRRPSTLSRSQVPGDNGDSTSFPEPMANYYSRRVVLVTRTFSIPWIDEEAGVEKAQPLVSGGRIVNPSQRRTLRSLMYAVTIVIALPIGIEPSPSVSRTSTFSRKAGMAYASQVAYASSAESDKQKFPSWLTDTMMETINAMSDVDDKTDLIGQHWDIFARALTTLQYMAQQKIMDIMKAGAGKPTYKLPTMSLTADQDLQRMVDTTATRVVRGMTIDRVRTGPGRWPSWREEARWLSSYSGGEKQNHFFQVLLSAFLATHTEWLQTLSPKWYKQKYREQQRLMPVTEAVSIPSRTIIVSGDKLAARRMVFLLAAFLPPSYTAKGDSSPVRPATSHSWRGYSQSPPKPVPVRQESLLRAINQRRARNGNSLPRQNTLASRTSSITATIDPDPQTVHSVEESGRQSLDTRSIRSKHFLADTEPSMKAETITAPTIAGPIVMRPHFSRTSSASQSDRQGHSRTSSAASASLLQPLEQRRRSSGAGSWTGRLGSLGRLWGLGGRRASASSYNEALQTTDEGLGTVDPRAQDSPHMIQQMVDDVQSVTADFIEFHPAQVPRNASTATTMDDSHPTVFSSPELPSASPEMPLSPIMTKPIATKPIDVPLKATMAQDGIIDVEIPFLTSASFSPPPTTPTSPIGTTGRSFEKSPVHTPPRLVSPPNPKSPPNVSGWLDKIHPDFTLLSLRPSPNTQAEIRAALSAEPNPPVSALSLAADKSNERWLDIASAVVADTSNWTITRIHLRRLVRYVRQANANPIMGPPGQRGIYGNPYAEPQLVGNAPGVTGSAEFILKEEWRTEKIAAFEPVIANFLERVIGNTGKASKVSKSRTQSTQSATHDTERFREQLPHPNADRSRDRERSRDAIPKKDPGAIVCDSLETLVADISRSMKEGDENVLRSGIRTWLEEVESKNVAIQAAKAAAEEEIDRKMSAIAVAEEEREAASGKGKKIVD